MGKKKNADHASKKTIKKKAPKAAEAKDSAKQKNGCPSAGKKPAKAAKATLLDGRACPCCKKHCPLAKPKCSKGKAVRAKLPGKTK